MVRQPSPRKQVRRRARSFFEQLRHGHGRVFLAVSTQAVAEGSASRGVEPPPADPVSSLRGQPASEADQHAGGSRPQPVVRERWAHWQNTVHSRQFDQVERSV